MFCSPNIPIAELRARIKSLEQFQTGDALPLGLKTIDSALPGGGLTRGALHEFLGVGPADGAATAFLAFVLGKLLATTEGPALWVTFRDDLFPPGLLSFGCPPHRLLLARCQTASEALWAMEEGLRCPALAGVAGNADPLSFTWTRRLQLAAIRARRPLFLSRHHAASSEASAAVTRWHVASTPSMAAAGLGPGAPCWRLDLIRCRGGTPRSWTVRFDPMHAALARISNPAGETSGSSVSAANHER